MNKAADALRLRPLQPQDETVFRAAHEELATEGFNFGLGLEAHMSWSDYLQALDDRRAGVRLPEGMVPETFLVADVGGEIVGRTSIRHCLNDYLEREGGHIGYGVVARHRRRGYATAILEQSLVVARSCGVAHVLVTCDDDNAGSIKVIESCGGRFDSYAPTEPGTPLKRRYWFD